MVRMEAQKKKEKEKAVLINKFLTHTQFDDPLGRSRNFVE